MLTGDGFVPFCILAKLDALPNYGFAFQHLPRTYKFATRMPGRYGQLYIAFHRWMCICQPDIVGPCWAAVEIPCLRNKAYVVGLSLYSRACLPGDMPRVYNQARAELAVVFICPSSAESYNAQLLESWLNTARSCK